MSGQRAATELAVRAARRVDGLQGGHEPGQHRRRLPKVGDRLDRRDVASKPSAHGPVPRVALGWHAVSQRDRDGQR